MNYNTDWSDTPKSAKRARVQRMRFVENAQVILVDKAYIRGSIVGGWFKLVEGAHIQRYKHTQRIEVECLWFGRKPKTSWMHITLLCEPKFFYGYTGKVALDLRT